MITVSIEGYSCGEWLPKHVDDCASWCDGDREAHYCQFVGVVSASLVDGVYEFECPECGHFVTSKEVSYELG